MAADCLVMQGAVASAAIVQSCFTIIFSPSGEQPEQRILACKQNNQLPVV